MSATSEFYLMRAAECARDAEKAILDNVRDRALRAESAWRAMADRIARSEILRDELTAAKAGALAEGRA